jgi:hypothetical protein
MLVISTHFTACNENNISSNTNGDSKISDSLNSQVNNAGTPALNNNLSVLFIESADFVRIVGGVSGNNKITFRFFITNPDSLTMHGWINSRGDSTFKPDPNMILFNGTDSLFLGSRTYLGNSVLYNKSIDKIVRMIGNKNRKYLVFLPQDPATNNGLLIYKIQLTDDDPKSISFSDLAISGEDTGEFTNPSPPRNAN